MWYSYAHWRAHVSPTEIGLCSHGSKPWRGHLHLSGVDHILNDAWMQWRKPTLLVNFVDLRSYASEPPHVEQIRRMQKTQKFRCMDLVMSNLHHRLKAVETFTSIARHLDADEEHHVIFFCKNGKDRSAFGILAFLQTIYRYSFEEAMLELRFRPAKAGLWPLVHLRDIPKIWWDWLESVVSEAQ